MDFKDKHFANAQTPTLAGMTIHFSNRHSMNAEASRRDNADPGSKTALKRWWQCRKQPSPIISILAGIAIEFIAQQHDSASIPHSAQPRIRFECHRRKVRLTRKATVTQLLDDVRNTQFGGTSQMPHKRNPMTIENIIPEHRKMPISGFNRNLFKRCPGKCLAAKPCQMQWKTN
jgi:hypothetical protein